jgi:phage shock protein A
VASTMYLGGRKVLAAEEIETRRQGLLEGLAVKRGELADAEQQVVALTAQVHRLEGGIIEAEWTLAQMSAQPAHEAEEES